MAFLAGLGFPHLFRVEGMGGMAAVAPVLYVMASFTKGLFQRVGKGLVLRVVFHPVP
jgi:hypothetical protein